MKHCFIIKSAIEQKMQLAQDWLGDPSALVGSSGNYVIVLMGIACSSMDFMLMFFCLRRHIGA